MGKTKKSMIEKSFDPIVESLKEYALQVAYVPSYRYKDELKTEAIHKARSTRKKVRKRK